MTNLYYILAFFLFSYAVRLINFVIESLSLLFILIQLIVKSYTMERLAELYSLYCSKYSDGSISAAEFEWIPGRILRCLYDKDFR